MKFINVLHIETGSDADDTTCLRLPCLKSLCLNSALAEIVIPHESMELPALENLVILTPLVDCKLVGLRSLRYAELIVHSRSNYECVRDFIALESLRLWF